MSRLKSVGESKVLSRLKTQSHAAEAYRQVRTNLRFASVDAPLRSMTVTSAVANEGKTLTSCNLATSLAQTGAKTLLVDADLRKPGQHRLFMMPGHTGLTTVLVGMLPIEDAIRPTSVENLFLLPAGDIPPNPAELLQSAAMRSLHQELLNRFDFVIYDSAPVLAAVEAMDLAAVSGATLLVVRAEKTPKDAVKQAVEQLRRTQTTMLGAVLNGVRPGRSYGYDYYSYGYGYGTGR